MNVFDKCEQAKKEIKSHITRSENVRLRVTTVMFERLKNTASVLHISRNELINTILDKVLI